MIVDNKCNVNQSKSNIIIVNKLLFAYFKYVSYWLCYVYFFIEGVTFICFLNSFIL